MFATWLIKPLSPYSDLRQPLNERHFMMMMGCALLLHIAVLVIYQFVPREDVIQIPVRSLNIKIGGGESNTQTTQSVQAFTGGVAAPAPSRPLAQPQVAANAPAVKALEHLIGEMEPLPEPVVPPREMPKPTATVKTTPNTEPTPQPVMGYLPPVKAETPAIATQVVSEQTVKQAQQMPSQFVRGDASAATAALNLAQMAPAAGSGTSTSGQGTRSGAGSAAGNSDNGSAEVLRRYEQVISLSIQRNKVYPADAKAQGLEGQAVIRIRINRQGTIVYSRIERPTRHASLNAAIAEMIRRSNPVPAVPVNYPAGNLFEFLIPVSFRLD